MADDVPFVIIRKDDFLLLVRKALVLEGMNDGYSDEELIDIDPPDNSRERERVASLMTRGVEAMLVT
jgi:hypothetical protein